MPVPSPDAPDDPDPGSKDAVTQLLVEARGGGTPDVPLDQAVKRGEVVFSAERIEQILGVDQALTRLASFNERGCRVVEYRFFGGLTHREVAEVMGLSVSTVRRVEEALIDLYEAWGRPARASAYRRDG